MCVIRTGHTSVHNGVGGPINSTNKVINYVIKGLMGGK